MRIVTTVLLLSVTGLYLYSLRRPREWLKEVDKKEHRLYFLYPMAELILSVSSIHKIFPPDREIMNSIKALKVTSKPEKEQRLYEFSKVALVIVVLTSFALISAFAMLSGKGATLLKEGKYLTRPEYGEGSSKAKLDVTLEGSASKEIGEKEDKRTRQITLEVAERSYTEEELGQFFEQGKEYILTHVLGRNTSLEAIDQNLSFCNTIPDTSIDVIWEPEDNTLVQSDGTIQNEGLTTTKSTSVTAVLSYGERRSTLCIYLRIVPPRYSEEEKLNRELAEEIKAADRNSKQEKEFKLPLNLGEYRLTWKEETKSTGGTMMLLGILLAIILWYVKDYELKNRMKRRKEQLLIDYPEIINKFTLLVNAGMTARQAWFKITEDYQDRLREGISPKRYAYEEMLITANELKLGLTEGSAYELYGKRISLLPYIKFSSLISQNLRKGNKGFTELLRKEATEAFENRKEIAKRLGEEAATKLLLPMMLLLMIVFLIILIPAFIAFRI